MQSNQATAIFDNAPKVDSHKVMSKAYMLLALSMLFTLIGSTVGAILGVVALALHPAIFLISFFAAIVGLIYGIQKYRDGLLGIIMLLTLTTLTGVLLGPILISTLVLDNGPEIVMLAAGGTCIMFFSMACIAMTAKKDFSFMGTFGSMSNRVGN